MTSNPLTSNATARAPHPPADDAHARAGMADIDDALRLQRDSQAVVDELLARCAPPRGTRSAPDPAYACAVHRLCGKLAAHLHVEETLLYPMLREHGAAGDAIDQAEVEHDCLRDLMDRLVDMHPDEPLFEARVRVLVEIFDLHLQRERLQLRPLLHRLDLPSLDQRMLALRDELLAEPSSQQPRLRFENEDADPVGEPPR